MAKAKRASGQITFRCPVEQHEELLELATIMGVDLNALLNMMLKQSLPSFRKKAKRQAAVHLAHSRLGSDEVAIPTEEPVIRQMIFAARQAPVRDRLQILKDYAQRFSEPGDPSSLETVNYAVELMERATALHYLRYMRAHRRQWSLRTEEEQLLGQLEQHLEQEIDKMKEKRELDKQRSREKKGS